MKDVFQSLSYTHEYWSILLPCVMIAIDFITGLIYAWSSKTFESSKMRKGLTKKVGEISIIVIGEVFSFAFGLPRYIMVGISLYIVLMELMSVFENLDKMGVPIPKFVKDVVNNTSESIMNDDAKTIEKKAKELEDGLDELKPENDEKKE